MTQPHGGFPQQPIPPAQGWQPPPGPPTKKKSKKWPFVVGAAVAVFAIIGVSGGGGDDDTTATSAVPTSVATPVSEIAAAAPVAPAEKTAAAPAPKALPGMNVPVRDGKFEFVVTDVETGLTSIGDNPYLMKQAQGQFVVVTMSVLNTSGEPKGLSPDNQEMYDAQGRKFTSDTSAALNLDSDVAIWDEINPGNTVTIKVVYDMPAGAQPAEMELHDSMFSGGVRVKLT
ncbi:DUF4352 domain-containing protein [Rhodococcus sp. WB9]|uniref:DUF4352 domain-containing protein n=1 Tax=Rhodococcus sp. WB9 TaxID=2594007 RepID=UPI0011864BE1|nr:DUF4352 domain-containing protein [Rhodococcus sp. WB9]QDQ94775.1 DUF4352 domain-containing protein [Rhodococcus sp. WB9]